MFFEIPWLYGSPWVSTWRLIATGPATGDLLLVEVTPVAGHIATALHQQAELYPVPGEGQPSSFVTFQLGFVNIPCFPGQSWTW